MARLILSYWPLLVIVAALAAIVYRIAPANLQILPYKLLLVCVAIYAAHVVDEVFAIDEDLPRAVVFLACMLGVTLGL